MAYFKGSHHKILLSLKRMIKLKRCFLDSKQKIDKHKNLENKEFHLSVGVKNQRNLSAMARDQLVEVRNL